MYFESEQYERTVGLFRVICKKTKDVIAAVVPNIPSFTLSRHGYDKPYKNLGDTVDGLEPPKNSERLLVFWPHKDA